VHIETQPMGAFTKTLFALLLSFYLYRSRRKTKIEW